MKSPRILWCVGVFLLASASYVTAANLPASPAKKISKTKTLQAQKTAKGKSGKAKSEDLPNVPAVPTAKIDGSYLHLQETAQNENRAYNSVSKIMKTKHDKVKNSVNNVR